MNALEELLRDAARRSSARFFLGVGRAARASRQRDEYTLPLFSLPLIMEAEGLLARDARHLTGRAA